MSKIPTDLYRMDDLLTDEERLIRSTVRSFATQEVLPRCGKLWDEGTFPPDLPPRLGELGLLGSTLNIPGREPVSHVAYGLMMQELERADSGLRSFASVQGSLAMYAIASFGSDEQKARWLPDMAAGKKIGCFGLTEPDHGSDPGGMKTRARRDGNDWILHGSKMWITNGTLSDISVVWARGEEGIRGFLVEKGTPGFEARPVGSKMSLRISDTAQLSLDEVRLPADAILPGAEGLGSALSCLKRARYSVAWGVLGAALACYEEAASFAGDRIMFDKPIAAFQLTQQRLAEMLTEITKAQLLVYRLGRLQESGEATGVMVSLAKRNNCDMAMNVARSARQLLGANGVSLEYASGRHMCNLESVVTYEGTHEVHTLMLGQAITGKAAFR